MEIRIINETGNELDTFVLDFTSILQEAETSDGTDPIANFVEIVEQRLRVRDLAITGESIDELQSLVAKAIGKGNALEHVKLKGQKLTKDLKKNSEDKIEFDDNLFETVLLYPNETAKREYENLVGLDEIKGVLSKESKILLSPSYLEEWSKKHHKGRMISACQAFQNRHPFIIFGGDVGNGKTALAESFGDALARDLQDKVVLFKISIQTRGKGIVGEMTQLITKVFKAVMEWAETNQKPVILLLDEADALAQSREEVQMHHEDKAGVDALIQGVDRIGKSSSPILVIFCTNRLDALDPAIKRRAAVIHRFARPNDEQRRTLLTKYFGDVGLRGEELDVLVKETGPKDRDWGYTFSDLVNRLIPNAVLDAVPDEPLTFKHIMSALQRTPPTPPFSESLTPHAK